MSNLLQLQDGAKGYGARMLFERASFSINAGEHVGVIGPNGAGKSTLFKILTREESLDAGELVQAKGLRIGYLAQHDNWAPGTLVEDFLVKDSLLPIWELKSLGRGLGLLEAQYARPLDSLSGGYRTRVKLLQLLGQKPDLLLLDEPTNYLDLESLLVLENFLQETQGAFLLISHDREFLRRTTDHILEVEGGEITKYNGSLDDYFEQKELLRTQLEARAATQQEKRQRILDFVSRFGAKATKARQAQSRLKSLAKMEVIEIKPVPNSARIQIPPPRHCGKVVLTLKNLDLGYGDRRILRDVNFSLDRGDHLAVVGVNGAGKSTLLKALAGKLEPLRGEFRFGHEVTMGYYAQHVAEALDPAETVHEALASAAHPDVTAQQVLNLAGSLLFSGDAMNKRVSVLSGGEKSRVALGRILLQRSPFIVLDEPTNHLDFQTVEALTEALRDFEGTVVVVSHDRGFVGRVGSKILEVRDGRAEVYPGTYDEYVWSVQKGVLSGRVGERASESRDDASAPRPTTAFHERKAQSKELRQLEKDVQKLEKRLPELQAAVAAANEAVTALPTPEKFAELAARQKELESTEEAWLESLTRLEELKAN